MKLHSPTLLLTFTTSIYALTADQWRSQSIYQIVTDRFARTDGSTTGACDLNTQPYCGGTWEGIIKKLPYIQGMGFTAIWISPVTAQAEGNSPYGTAYHGYWQRDFNSLNPKFGTAADLKALSKALHARGMYLMVDVVTNHMAYISTISKVNYKSFVPFNDPKYFHPYCLIDYSNITSCNVCWLGDNAVPLPDLKTEDPFVQKFLGTWIGNLVTNYSIDGLRLDTAKHVSGYLAAFQKAARGVHVIGEIYSGDVAEVCSYQGGTNGLSGVMNFPACFQVGNTFSSTTGSMKDLATSVYVSNQVCKDQTVMGSFIENHDLPRFASRTADLSLAKNAIGFSMLQDGIPIIYYGQEQHFSGSSVPTNREALWLSTYPTTSPLYTYIARLNAIRKHAISQSPTWTTSRGYFTTYDSSTIVMRKGVDGANTVAVWSNLGQNGKSYTLLVKGGQLGFGNGVKVVEMVECRGYTTGKDGSLSVAMGKGAPRVFYPAARVKGSGVCEGVVKREDEGEGEVGVTEGVVKKHGHSHGHGRRTWDWRWSH